MSATIIPFPQVDAWPGELVNHALENPALERVAQDMAGRADGLSVEAARRKVLEVRRDMARVMRELRGDS